MKQITILGLAAALVVVVAVGATRGQCDSREAGAVAARMALRGIHFVPNQGQWPDSSVRYGFRSRGVEIAFRESALTMRLSRDAAAGIADDPRTLRRHDGALEALLCSSAPGASTREALVLGVSFPGSNAAAPVGAQPLDSRFNYFLGNDGSRWRRDVGSFGAVVYENLYDGIDLHITGADGGVLKYEFQCDPAADHTCIRVRYDNADSLRVGQSGDLEIETPFGTLRDKAPRAWQDIDGQRRALPARFEALDAQTYTIRLLAAPDPAHALVIDPEVEWMTYLGGSDVDWGFDIALNHSGSALVSGHTTSADFAGGINAHHGGSSDAFVAQVDPSGTIQWMTYLGGTSFDLGRGMALDSAGRALLTGWTNSDDFAGANNTFHGGSLDAFVARLSTTGTLEWMTYLGGSADDYALGIAVDAADAAWVTGDAYSTNFQGRINSHHGGAYDAFAARVHPSGALDWMRYLGGNNQDEANGIAIDGAGAAVVVGDTWSPDFEGRINFPAGNRDAFVVRIHNSGALDWMAYFGGSANEAGYGIALDSGSAALISGATTSTDFVGRNNAHHGGTSAIDSFLARIDSNGAIEWMMYLGGTQQESALRVAIDPAGAALVSGSTQSPDFEGRGNSYHGVRDAFVVRVHPAGILDWMTYLGGSGDDGGFGIAVDAAGAAFITGRTNSATFVGQTNTYHGGPSWGDAFVLKLRLPPTCYPNCDSSTQAPILNIADFACFLTRFAAADPYANCDNSTTPPTLNIADFGCFLQKFAAGCP